MIQTMAVRRHHGVSNNHGVYGRLGKIPQALLVFSVGEKVGKSFWRTTVNGPQANYCGLRSPCGIAQPLVDILVFYLSQIYIGDILTGPDRLYRSA